MKKSLILAGLLSIGYAHAQYEEKVGINTEQPSATLNVKSKTGTTKDTKNFELENADGTKMVTVLDNGNVGIGTDKPQQKLQVVGLANISDAGVFYGDGYPLSVRGKTSKIAEFYYYDNQPGQAKTYPRLFIQGDTSTIRINTAYSSGGGSNLGIGTNSDKNLLFIKEAGNPQDKRNLIGIGTLTPENKLHIKADADPLKLEGLQQAGAGAQNLVVENGVVKIGVASAGLTSEVDGVIGNEVSGVIDNGGLRVEGTGTTDSPLKVGIKEGGVTGGMLANGSVTGDKLAPSSVDASKLADRAVTSDKLGITGSPNQILTFQGGKWVAADAPAAPAELDGVIGNEVADVVANRGLERTGTGTSGDPYKVGLISGAKDGDTLVWSQTENKWKVQAFQNSAGKVIKKFRTVALPLAAGDWTDDDFTIRITGQSATFELPDPATNAGRVIALRNGEGTGRTISKYPPVNNTTISGNRGMLLHSDGSNWHVIGGF